MADDNNSRYRSSAPYSREPAPGAPANDPLAELARLIGQSDPFAEFGRDTRPAAAAPPQQQQDAAARYANPAPPFSNDPPPPQRYAADPAPSYGQEPTTRYGAEFPPPPPRYGNDHPTHSDWQSAPPPPAFLTGLANDPFGLPSQQPAPQYDSSPSYNNQGYNNQGYDNQGYDNQAYADPHARPAADSFARDLPGFEPQPQGYAAAPDRQGFSQPPLYPHEQDGGSMPPPHDDEFYDDAPRGGRRKGLLTVAAVFGLAVIGTAGAFGYRSFFGGAASSGPPPVIRASGEPTKVAPPPASTDASTNKFSYDRFGDAGKDEQVVKREEKPVDPKELARTAVPRTVLPGAPVPNAPASRSASANPPSAIGEPRRVRTVPIRPDQQDVAASMPTATADAPMQLAPSRQANNAPAATALPPPPAAPQAAPRPAAPRTPSRVVATRSAPAAASPEANAPLSLSPDANNSSMAPPSGRDSTPPPQVRASAPPPARVASAPASGGGGYLVQVSSQKSEADAQSSFRSIQSKYASVLGNQPHTIRRADLGSKGVYFRAMVGPFGSREQAIQLCTSLKQAGGDCVVQH